MSTKPELLRLRVRAITCEADGVLGFELVPLAANTLLPAFESGAHINLYLEPRGGGQLVRSYSLLNLQGERHRYCIGVNRDAKSRGGSRQMHELLRAGDVISVSPPANNFRLNEGAATSAFIAGGIGITPVLGMLRRLSALHKPWRLVYAARSRANAAFVPTLQALADEAAAALQFHFDDEQGGRPLDMAAAVASLPSDAHAYCCGPLPMLAAFEAATAAWPRERVHVEYFSAPEAAAIEGGFTVELSRSGRSVRVAAGQTILDTLLALGIEPPYSCQQGVCGTCEVRVLQGIPDHRDLVLTPEEHAANDRMMICCSGAKTPRLVIDL